MPRRRSLPLQLPVQSKFHRNLIPFIPSHSLSGRLEEFVIDRQKSFVEPVKLPYKSHHGVAVYTHILNLGAQKDYF